MDGLELSAVEYLQVGVTERKSLKLLPNSENRRLTQKVVVGDKNGILQCFGYKKGELVCSVRNPLEELNMIHLGRSYAFITLNSALVKFYTTLGIPGFIKSIFKLNSGAPISKVELGGALGTVQDKIFIASGSEVRGYSRKGKMFLDFNSNMTEAITSLCISGSDLLVSGMYMYNRFSDCIDQGYYLSSDKIMDILCLPNNRTENDELVPVLACNDRNLRVLKGCNLQSEIELPGIPQCITSYESNDPDAKNEIVYGTSDGCIGHVQLTSNKPEYKWTLSNSKNLGGISSLSHYDVTGDGVSDLLVGRDDGTVEVFTYDGGDEPMRIFSHTLRESVTSVHGGVVGKLGSVEVVASTYSGWVVGLTNDQKKRGSVGSTSAEAPAPVPAPETQQKLKSLRVEVDTLQRKVAVERAKRNDKSKATDTSLLRLVEFDVNDNFKLNPTTASYQLTIEVQTDIDYIVIQTDVPVDLLEQSNIPAVVSRSPKSDGDAKSNNYLLVTYRCQANTSRLKIQFRSIEGHYGYIQAYIVPRLQVKSALLRRYPVRPLSLHQRSHSVDSKRPFNLLKLTGPFSIGEIHSWVCFCLPDVPERPPPGEDVTLHFTNTFLDTQLECAYKKGEGVFRSDNISTISILKDILSKQATGKKIALNIHYEVNEGSIPHTLDLLHPKMDYQFLLVKKVNLLNGLQELQTHEGSMEFLAPEYQQILENASELKSEYEKQPLRLERLYGMITDLYIDKFKFKGVNVKNKVPKLLEILDSYDLASLKTFFAKDVY